jgi:ADP-ribosyl-[dinitrogen reductase] hydrolase
MCGLCRLLWFQQLNWAKPEQALRQRVLGAYIGLAVGDALGATTEFMTPSEIEHTYGVHRKIIGGGWLRLKPGQVTDDTEMSLALGDAILQQGRVDAVAIAEAFSQWMRSKPVDIGHTVRRGIVHYRNSGETKVPENEYDAGNGACMRALPIALLHWNASDEELVRDNRIQSHITHNNPLADAGSETILRMIAAALKSAAWIELKRLAYQLVEQHARYNFERREQVNPSAYIVDTLRVVLQAFFSFDGFESGMISVVNRGGDADTTGAIYGMLAGAYYGLEDIPRVWIKALNPDVRRRCEQQALGLLALSGQKSLR